MSRQILGTLLFSWHVCLSRPSSSPFLNLIKRFKRHDNLLYFDL